MNNIKIIIEGEQGVGKTTLASLITELLRREDVSVFMPVGEERIVVAADFELLDKAHVTIETRQP